MDPIPQEQWLNPVDVTAEQLLQKLPTDDMVDGATRALRELLTTLIAEGKIVPDNPMTELSNADPSGLGAVYAQFQSSRMRRAGEEASRER